ncbi:YeiH family protein [Phyllobacterium endophyticum]|uniref:YeiH family protein n=1 Tax=Phyllobacterium endophyticum TaxID=1149773 RepID=UPI001FEEEF92|nr:YeiH family protein [Phyllobacterium endophyticum]
MFSPDPWRLRSAHAAIHLLPGLTLVATVAMASQFLSDHYGAPAMLMGLLLGIAFNFLSEEGSCVPGIGFAAKQILRIGVALLGLRISVSLFVSLGGGTIILLAFAIAATLLFGVTLAKLLGKNWQIGVLTGAAVGICGASAAMAISAVLPKNEDSERDLLFTVLIVTLLSTLAMIFYPIFAQWLGLDASATSVFLGGTIHDVAQVVGAGFSVSDDVGEAATLVKLIRVTLLAPVVLVISFTSNTFSRHAGENPARQGTIPGFLLAFLILAGANSAGIVPESLSTFGAELSRWALLVGMAAVGMKTSFSQVRDVGGYAITLVAAETVFVAMFILTGMHYSR